MLSIVSLSEQQINPENALDSGSREHDESGREAVGDSGKRAPTNSSRVT